MLLGVYIIVRNNSSKKYVFFIYYYFIFFSPRFRHSPWMMGPLAFAYTAYAQCWLWVKFIHF